MSRFVNREAVDEIVLTGGDKVQVRQRLDAVEEAELNQRLARWQLDSATGQMTLVEGDWHLLKVHVCEAYVVGWDFKDDDGALVPFDRALIRTLDPETVKEIAQGVDALQAKHAEERAKKGARR